MTTKQTSAKLSAAADSRRREGNGRFDTEVLDSTSVELAGSPRLDSPQFERALPEQATVGESRKGVTSLVDPSLTHSTKEHDGYSVHQIQVSLRGNPHRTAMANAVTAALRVQEQDTLTYLNNMDGKKATVVTQDKRGRVEVNEGTVTRYGEDYVLQAKGARSLDGAKYLIKGGATPRTVLDVTAGYAGTDGLQAAAEDYNRRTAFAPTLVPSTFEDIPDDAELDDPPVTAAFVFDHPGFDGSQDGRSCIFAATSKDPDGSIYGYFIAPAGSGLTSEHGSFTQKQLTDWGGRVEGFPAGSLRFSDAMRLGDYAEEENDHVGALEVFSGRGRVSF